MIIYPKAISLAFSLVVALSEDIVNSRLESISGSDLNAVMVCAAFSLLGCTQ
jgi:hypothetical protein